MQRSVALAHALADATRWRISCLIAEEALCVCELADILGLPQSTLSSQLQVMRKGGLVTAERSEKWAYYQLEPEILPVWQALSTLNGRDAKSDRTLAADRKKAAVRIALRGQSECKGPRRSIPPEHRVPRKAAAARC